jgi:glycine cleavage system H protein
VAHIASLASIERGLKATALSWVGKLSQYSTTETETDQRHACLELSNCGRIGTMSETAPKNGEYFEGKMWFQRKGTTVTLGVTNVAIEEIGSVQSIEFPEDGLDFEKGEVILTIEGTNGSLEATAPASGIVQEINEAAKEEPDMVSDDPLEEGWLVKIEIQDTSDLKEFVV